MRARTILTLAAVLAFWPGGDLAAQEKQEPPPRLKLTFAERFRFEAWDNAIRLDDRLADEFAYTRNKTTLGLQWRPAAAWDVTVKVSNEFRLYLTPDRPFTWNEVFFDNAYVKWTGRAGLPLTVTAGRQDMRLGEGFVVADGNPLDGSRSYYFNALRLDFGLAEGHTLTAFAHGMPERDRLPVLDGQNQRLVEQPERGWALYYQGRTSRRIALDGYYLDKTVAVNGPPTIGSRIRTTGLRVVTEITEALRITAEGALQGGSWGSAGRSAHGGIAHLDWSPRGLVPFLKTAVVGGVSLSGDRPGTEDQEGWDPVFSRWPMWSNGYIYTFTFESRVAYWSNFRSLYGTVVLDFGPRANADFTVHRLTADEAPADPSMMPVFGRDRGVLLIGHLNYTVSRHLTGNLTWERFNPGNFYPAGADPFDWFRFELQFRY